jgi:hypothetical protein
VAKHFYKQESKNNFYRESPLTDEQIRTGALLRIAESLETLAADRDKLQRERDNYKKWMNDYMQTLDRRNRQIAGLYGYIGRLKKTVRRKVK